MSVTWWSKITSAYFEWVNDLADPRTAVWPLVQSPWNPILAVCCYLYLSLNARSLTEKMRTYQLRSFIIFYNALMVLLSSYMAFEFAATAYLAGYNLLCQPVDFSTSPLAIRMAKVCWLYYFSKYIELVETGVFALRKKYNQISILHVYHHASMIIIWWLAVKFTAGGQAYIFGAINSFVHAVMYTYYGLSALGPWIHKYLWWKKYITMLQLSQFVILFFYCIRSITINCGFAKWLCLFMIGYSITLLTLFLNFYIRTYLKKDSKQRNGDAKLNGSVIRNGSKKSN